MQQIILTLSSALVPLLVGFILIHGLYKKVPVYEVFVSGAKSGIIIGFRILPYLIAMMVAVSVFRVSGALDFLTGWMTPVLVYFGISPDLIPLAFMRSLSGSGTLGIFSEIAAIHGPDSPVTKTAAIMTGSSETTFYVLAVYFGSVGITRFRYAIIAGIVADIAGIIMALIVSKMLF